MKTILSYLDRYLTTLREPSDLISLFAGIRTGRKHLLRGLRNLFNYLEALGHNTDYLKALPKDICGVDIRVPEEKAVLQSLRRIDDLRPEYGAVYSLLLDSGLRLVEAVKLINDFKGAESISSGFYRCGLGMFRGSKQAYYLYVVVVFADI